MFVTGGTGIVGRAVVKRLKADGRDVRALARSDSSAHVLSQLGADPMPGDILDTGSLEEGMRGCSVAYHVAGVNQFCLRDTSAMYQANVTGSSNVVKAAARAGIGRLVYTSSAVTLGEAAGSVGREDSVHRGRFLSAYERSKFDAERLTLELAAQLDVEVTCVNPSSVQGPGRVTGTGEVLIRYLRGELKVWVDTTVSFVDIDDCAEGHVQAEVKGQAGQRYVLNAASLPTDALLGIMARLARNAPVPRLVPPSVAMAAAGMVELAARARGRTPIICRESLRTLLHGHRYDGARAQTELGVQYRPVEETIRRTARWLVAEGRVPQSALA